MREADDLSRLIHAALPPDQRLFAPRILALIEAIASGDSQDLPPELLPTLLGIAGRRFESGGSLVEFGANNQFGDVTLQGDIAGGNIIKLTINFPPTTAAAAQAIERHAPRLFICASRADRAAVDTLSRALKLRGLRLWRDLDDLYLGRLAQETIETAITEVTAVLIYLTPASLESEFIRSVEVEAALRRAYAERDFVIIPVLDGVDQAEIERAFGRSRVRLTDYQYHELPAPTDPARPAAFAELARKMLEAVLVPRLSAEADLRAIRIDLASITPTRYDLPAVAALDWSPFCTDGLPTPAVWATDLAPGLADLHRALRQIGPRPIALRPAGTRLSAALGFGYVFRQTTHFHLWVEQQLREPSTIQWWCTDGIAEPGSHLTPTPVEGDPAGSDLFVEISAGPAVFSMVDKWLAASTSPPPYYRRLQLIATERSVPSAARALAIARQVRAAITDQLHQRQPETIHLFYAGPVALAAFIGWHLNKLGAFRVYEYAGGTYVPAVEVGPD